MKLDIEEKKNLEAYEKGEIKTEYPSKKELEEVKITAENTFRKNRRITIRLYDHDYKGIQKKAMGKAIALKSSSDNLKKFCFINSSNL